MLLSQEMEKSIEQGSVIRKMFETGNILRKEFGAENVYDFSLGNPDLAPPASVGKALYALAEMVHNPASLGYMPNAGFAFARETLAQYLSKEQHCHLTVDDVLLTCGAAGGMQVFFRTVLNPGDLVLGISPYFVEYNKYVTCNGGIFQPIPSLENFQPDLKAMEKAISEKTRAILINSPNNPTGCIYSIESIHGLLQLAEKATEKYGHMVYLISDEPYRFLSFDKEVASLLDKSPNAVVLGSFSKNLALAGERIGYIALSPLLEGRSDLMAGLVQANRFLGFVNAPVIGQYIMDAALNSPDLESNLEKSKSIYRKRRELLADILKEAGIEFIMPEGTFYFFPKSPVADEEVFINALKEERVLAVPGVGFGCKGYFRLSFAIDENTIINSRQGFLNAVKKVKSK